MGRYLLVRIAAAVPSLVLITVLVFLLVRLIPGDPVAALLELQRDPAVVAELRSFYGLDRPIYVQYLNWVSTIMSGSFGRSFMTGLPVTGLILERFPRTVYLMLGGVSVSLLIAIPAGIIAATHRRSWSDHGVTSLATLAMAVPNFWLGILLMLLFGVMLGWLPTTGYTEPQDDFLDFLRHMVLPWFTLGSALAALTTRMLRSSLLDVLSQDYMRTARAKGLGERAMLVGHALRNAAIPTITVIGLQAGYLMGGAVVTERVFAYPGMGLLLVGSIFNRDYPVIQAGIILFAFTFIVINLLTDTAYALVDPRIRPR
jgi:peptide/nickel transport system permease protein